MEPKSYMRNDAPAPDVDPTPGPNEEVAPPPITGKRRRELYALALDLVDTVEKATQPHERCFLRRMVENLLDDY